MKVAVILTMWEHNPPKVEGKCDKCNGTLVQRKDDHPETVKDRLHVYHEQTEPLKGYYEKQGKLFEVKGEGDINEITRLTLAAIEAFQVIYFLPLPLPLRL